MAVTRINADGSIEVIVPPTPEEEARAMEGLKKVAAALARLVVAEEFKAREAAARRAYERKKFEMTSVLRARPVMTRRVIAARQLDAAVRNLVLDEDIVAAHLLGWAALDVISDVAAGLGRETVRGGMTALMSPELRKAWRRAERDHYNFMKHADRDPDRTIRLAPDLTTFALYVACRDYVKTFDDSTPVMAVYTGWYLSQTPEMRSGFGEKWDDVLVESFGEAPDEAWKQAKTMIEVAVKYPDSFQASLQRRSKRTRPGKPQPQTQVS